MKRFPPTFIVCAVGVATGILIVGGCTDGPATTPGAHSSVAAPPNELEAILGSWPVNATPSDEIIERFVQLASRADWEESLRISDLSEVEFAAITQDQRTELHGVLLKRFGRLRSLAKATLERAETLRDQGHLERANTYAEAVRRAGDANAKVDLLLLSQMVGEALQKQAAEYASEH